MDFAAAQPEVDASRIGVFGYSMGTCIAARAAARDPRLRALVLRGTFTRLDEQLRIQFRSRAPFAEELAILAAERAGVRVQELDTETAFRALGNRPVFLVAGDQDFAVPPAHSRRLAARGQPSRARTVEEVERDLKAVFPRDRWNKLHLQIIYFGRKFCTAKGHVPSACPICSWAMSKARAARETKQGLSKPVMKTKPKTKGSTRPRAKRRR